MDWIGKQREKSHKKVLACNNRVARSGADTGRIQRVIHKQDIAPALSCMGASLPRIARKQHYEGFPL